MSTEYGQVTGPLIIRDELILHGMIVGDVTVERGGFLQVYGMITGHLRVEDGGAAEVRGIVSKDTTNAGSIEVYGIIVGRLSSTYGASTTLVRGSQVNGVTQ